jgi:hypothetical protein
MKFVPGIMVAAFIFSAAPARAQDADKVDAVGRARQPLGGLISRKVKSARS